MDKTLEEKIARLEQGVRRYERNLRKGNFGSLTKEQFLACMAHDEQRLADDRTELVKKHQWLNHDANVAAGAACPESCVCVGAVDNA